jgi:DNA-3-methyladenine glycosylase II
MSNSPKYWNSAKKYLSKKDKVMASLINKYRSPSETILTSRKDVFFHYAKALSANKLVSLLPMQFF